MNTKKPLSQHELMLIVARKLKLERINRMAKQMDPSSKAMTLEELLGKDFNPDAPVSKTLEQLAAEHPQSAGLKKLALQEKAGHLLSTEALPSRSGTAKAKE